MSLALRAAGLIEAPLFVAITLSATALGIVVSVLANAGELGSTLGRQVVAVILLSLFFSGEAGGMGSSLLLLGGFLVLVAAVGSMLAGFGRVGQLRSALQRLQDSSAQIRVRGAFVLLVGFVVLARPVRSAENSGNPLMARLSELG